jgi:hypothetical protein
VISCQMKKMPEQGQREAKERSPELIHLLMCRPSQMRHIFFAQRKKGKYKGALRVEPSLTRPPESRCRRSIWRDEVKWQKCVNTRSLRNAYEKEIPHEQQGNRRKGNMSRKRIYVVAAPGTGTDRAAQSLVVYPALKKLPFDSCRDLL